MIGVPTMTEYQENSTTAPSRTRTGSFHDVEEAPNLDNILATQPELGGPTVPDGGYGWVVFLATLFFQALMPSLMVSFGVFLAFTRLENLTKDDEQMPRVWDESLLLVPLFFLISRTIFDAASRAIIQKSTWPRLVGTSGTCLACAGLLFMWMGQSGSTSHRREMFVLAGLVTGFGVSLQLAQCDILLAQYFKLKLPVLIHLSKCVRVLGFMVTPVILGRSIISTSLLHVILWYQAILVQGLVINIAFKKPTYLKSRSKPYQFVATSPDDEEDIFSKNSRELQIKRQTSTESHVVVTKIEIEARPGSSLTNGTIPASSENHVVGNHHKNSWEKFSEDDEEEVKYDKLNGWETFDNEEFPARKNGMNLPKNHPNFPENSLIGNGKVSQSPVNNLSFADELQKQDDFHDSSSVSKVPAPLFSDMPVNNNTSYAYDDEIRVESQNSNVFMPNSAYQTSSSGIQQNWLRTMEHLRNPSFYKSLLMSVTSTFSIFGFFALFPSYLYVEGVSHIRQMTVLMGALCLVPLTFLLFSYCIRVDKKKRHLCLWIMCWFGAVGYFMIGDFNTQYVLIAGAIQVIFSIESLDHFGQDLWGLSIKGEANSEYALLKCLTGLSLFIFLFMDMSIKGCFHVLALLHFLTGALWLASFVYRRIAF